MIIPLLIEFIKNGESKVFTDDIEEDSIAGHLSPKEDSCEKENIRHFARELKKIGGYIEICPSACLNCSDRVS